MIINPSIDDVDTATEEVLNQQVDQCMPINTQC